MSKEMPQGNGGETPRLPINPDALTRKPTGIYELPDGSYELIIGGRLIRRIPPNIVAELKNIAREAYGLPPVDAPKSAVDEASRARAAQLNQKNL